MLKLKVKRLLFMNILNKMEVLEEQLIMVFPGLGHTTESDLHSYSWRVSYQWGLPRLVLNIFVELGLPLHLFPHTCCDN